MVSKRAQSKSFIPDLSKDTADFEDPILLRRAYKIDHLGLNSFLVALAAWQRGLEVTFHYEVASKSERFAQTSGKSAQGTFFSVSDGERTHFFMRTLGDLTSKEISRLCDDKQATKTKLIEAGVPVPDGILIEKTAPHKAELESFVQRHPGKRFHVKPLGGSLAVGAFGGLTAAELADCITEHDEQWLLVEEHITGFPVRVNVVGNRYVGAYACVPPRVIGDGTSTIVELVDQKNRSRRHKPLHPRRIIHLDDRAEICLMHQGLTPASIPDIGQSVLINTELQTEQGADFVEATQSCSQLGRELAVRACIAVGVPFGGVDILIDEDSGRHVVLEVNQCPMLKGNVFPFYVASPGNRVAEALIDYYFPESIGRLRFTKASFDFVHICNALKSSCVSEVSLPVLTADWVHKRIKLPAGNSEKSPKEAIRTIAAIYGVYVDVFQVQKDEIVLDVLGPESRYKQFLAKLKALTQNLKRWD